MGFMIRDGKLAFGAEPAKITGFLIFRLASTTSVVGEPLACDIANTSYDGDADEGGVFGNGVTPTSGATWTQDFIQAPWGVVTKAGVATGNPVDVCFHGLASVLARQTTGAAFTTRFHFQGASTARFTTGALGGTAATVRNVGFSLTAGLADSTTTLVPGYFNGLGRTA